MKVLLFILLLCLPCSLQSQTVQTEKGVILSFVPVHPFVYTITDISRVRVYSEGSGYEDVNDPSLWKEFRPRRGICLDLGYQFNRYLGAGIFATGSLDALDVGDGTIHGGVFLTYSPVKRIDIHGRLGWINTSSYTREGLVYGGGFDFHFPSQSTRFAYGIRTGLYYMHGTDGEVINEKHEVYDFQTQTTNVFYSTETIEEDYKRYLIDLGMFFRWTFN